MEQIKQISGDVGEQETISRRETQQTELRQIGSDMCEKEVVERRETQLTELYTEESRIKEESSNDVLKAQSIEESNKDNAVKDDHAHETDEKDPGTPESIAQQKLDKIEDMIKKRFKAIQEKKKGLESQSDESLNKNEKGQGANQTEKEKETKKVDQTPMSATEKIDRIKDLIEEYKAKKAERDEVQKQAAIKAS